MKKYIWIAVVVGLLALTIFVPFWPVLVGYVLLMWFACPNSNFLSSGCGSITPEFVIGHYLAPLVVIILLTLFVRHIYSLWKQDN